MRTVKELADLSGVSVRTLHHYDFIGLLKPSERSEAGYRLYGRAEYLRLQQILFYREMGISLEEIGKILDAPDFDLVSSLKRHRHDLLERKDHILSLVRTIDRTLEMLSGKEEDMLTEKQLYEGFSPEEIDGIKREVREKFDPLLVAESDRRVRSMTRAEWARIKEEGERLACALADLMDRDPSDPEVQKRIADHHRWIENFYPCHAEIYRGLADLYVEDSRFRAHYDKYREGLVDFMKPAMLLFAEGLEM